jgi:hypothetical protein
MKKFALIALVLSGCGYEHSTVENKSSGDFKVRRKGAVTPVNITVVEIDGCEYLCLPGSNYTMSLTHKGNCKGCQARKK